MNSIVRSAINVTGVATASYVKRAEDAAHEESESIDRMGRSLDVTHPARFWSSRHNYRRGSH